MSDVLPRLLPLGDTAWTVEFGDVIDPALHGRVLGLAAAIKVAREAGTGPVAAIVDVVPTFRSLTVHFDAGLCEGEALGRELLRLAAESGVARAQGRRWALPVCFDADFAPDLADLAQSKGLTPEAVIARLTATEFQVYMIGFMPGFPYMGGLPAELHLPRLASPRKAVPERTLAVANDMCAVYPWESPGGWRLLGRTPLPLFAAADPEPALLASGDRVRWHPIDRATYLDLEAAGRAGLLERRQFLAEAGEQS